MTIPTGLLPDSIFKTVALSREAFETRLKNGTNELDTTPSFHHGTPDATNLPRESVGVYLHLEAFEPDIDSPYNAEALLANWEINIVVEDRGDDQFGADPTLGDKLAGQVLESLFSELGDTSLDSAVEEINFLGGNSVIGGISGGDRRIHAWTLQIQARHPLQPVRC